MVVGQFGVEALVAGHRARREVPHEVFERLHLIFICAQIIIVEFHTATNKGVHTSIPMLETAGWA